MAKQRHGSSLDGLLAVAKALSDPARVRILSMLGGRDLCVCQITAVIGLAPSTVSKHLTVLRQAGLVETRKSARWVHCSIPARTTSGSVRSALRLIGADLAGDARIAEDAARLRRVLAVPPERLCRKRGGR